MWPLYFTLVLSSVILVSDVAESAFSRQCEHAGQCVFEPKGSNDRAYLDCVDMKCVCSRFLYIADVPAWDLEMDGSTCRIAEGGPCGSDGGLDVACQSNADCVQGRCRKAEKVGTRKEGDSCNEDIDCLKELKCSITAFYFQPTRRCTNKTFVSPFPKGEPSSKESDEMSEEKMETTTLHGGGSHGGSSRGSSKQESREAPNSGMGGAPTSSRSTKSGETEVRSAEARPVNQGRPAPSAVSPPQSVASGVGQSHADMQTKSAGGGHNGEAQPQQNAGHKIFQISSLLPFILVSTVVAAGLGNGLLRGHEGLNC